jgi:hypothetical protein
MSSIKLNYEIQVSFLSQIRGRDVYLYIKGEIKGPSTKKNTTPPWTKSGRC